MAGHTMAEKILAVKVGENAHRPRELVEAFPTWL
jgi:hypothetical protein